MEIISVTIAPTRWQGLGSILAVFGLFGVFLYAAYLYDMPSRDPAVRDC